MAERIIYRGRPRANKPYMFQQDVAAIPETADYFLFGPLTIDELMEFKYRIKKFTVTGSVTYEGVPTEEDENPIETINLNYDIVRGKLLVRVIGGGQGVGGILQSKTEAYEKESDFSQTFITGTIGLFNDVFYKETSEYVNGISQPSIDMSSTEPYKTDAGYYLPIIVSLYDPITSSGFASVNRGEEEFEGEVFTDIQLKVKSKTHNIRCRVNAVGEETIGGSLTVEASEWWPYANADGQPIWNTATGARTSNPFS